MARLGRADQNREVQVVSDPLDEVVKYLVNLVKRKSNTNTFVRYEESPGQKLNAERNSVRSGRSPSDGAVSKRGGWSENLLPIFRF